MKDKYWKILALIFIPLFIVETLFVGYIIYIGLNLIDNENECVANCMNVGEDSTYAFYEHSNICQCYMDHKLVKTIYMG